jgi:hypothetical protein
MHRRSALLFLLGVLAFAGRASIANDAASDAASEVASDVTELRSEVAVEVGDIWTASEEEFRQAVAKAAREAAAAAQSANEQAAAFATDALSEAQHQVAEAIDQGAAASGVLAERLAERARQAAEEARRQAEAATRRAEAEARRLMVEAAARLGAATKDQRHGWSIDVAPGAPAPPAPPALSPAQATATPRPQSVGPVWVAEGQPDGLATPSNPAAGGTAFNTDRWNAPQAGFALAAGQAQQPIRPHFPSGAVAAWGTPPANFPPPQGGWWAGGQPGMNPWGNPPGPAEKLRETAFEVDRLAHGLEQEGLYEAADTLRRASQVLRERGRAATKQPALPKTAVSVEPVTPRADTPRERERLRSRLMEERTRIDRQLERLRRAAISGGPTEPASGAQK